MNGRKTQWISEKEKTAELPGGTKAWFKEAEFFEKQTGKDLCEWNAFEIMEFLRYQDTSRVHTLNTIVSVFRMYTDWCMENGLVPDHQNHYNEISLENILQCSNNSLFDHFISREDLMDRIQCLYNACDQFLIVAIFEGLTTKEMGVTIADIDIQKRCIRTSKRTLPISEELCKIASAANMETEYHNRFGSVTEFDPDDDRIVRGTVYRGKINHNYSTLLAARYNMAMEFMGTEKLNRKDMSESGRIWNMKKHGYTIDTIDEALKPYNEHWDIYGRIQSLEIWKRTYGRFL